MASNLGINKQQLNAKIKVLEGGGYVFGTTDTVNRKIVRADLTEKGQQLMEEIDINLVDQISTAFDCFSEVTLNKRCLSLLNKKKISILFYNFYGNYTGRFTPKEYINGKILLEQVHAYEDFDKRLYIAKTILKGSLHNMLSLVKYYRKKGKKLMK